MKHGMWVAGVLAIVAAGAPLSADTPAVQGEYVEARTCDVWTGPCFSNSETALRGKNAVVGWSVTKGAWDGVALDGLKIAAVLNSEDTLHTRTEGKVEAVVFVDASANERQARALLSLARSLAPRHLGNILKVEKTDITFTRDGLTASLKAGPDVTLRTTPLCPCDAICCNEEQAYPAVSDSTRVVCAKTAEHAYRGMALSSVRWSDPGSRSAMVGTFSR